MRLLFITQKLHGQDAFILHWLRAFLRKGYQVVVLCLEGRSAPLEFPVYSLGKEKGNGKLRQIGNFYKHILSLRYDRVFIHMSPVWYALGFLVWLWRHTPVYLWYTHYKVQLGVKLFGIFGKRFFCATEQSLPQYAGSPKKVVTGHGIDLAFWVKRPNKAPDPHALLVVHRLSRSKRLEIAINALTLLPQSHTLTIYGIEAEPDYVAELRLLVAELGLQSRVTFKGSVPMGQLAEIYPKHRLTVNMASETIDKSMLEAMTCGCYPVTTKRNAHAVGLPYAPESDTPEAVAQFIREFPGANPDELYRIVAENHSLEGMVGKMDEYMAAGL